MLKEEMNFWRDQILGGEKKQPKAPEPDTPKEMPKEPKQAEPAKKERVIEKKPGKREAYIVYYQLSEKSPVEKVQFSYALTGRTNQIGLLQKLKGKKLGKGCLMVPSSNVSEIEKFFKEWKLNINKQKIIIVDERPM